MPRADRRGFADGGGAGRGGAGAQGGVLRAVDGEGDDEGIGGGYRAGSRAAPPRGGSGGRDGVGREAAAEAQASVVRPGLDRERRRRRDRGRRSPRPGGGGPAPRAFGRGTGAIGPGRGAQWREGRFGVGAGSRDPRGNEEAREPDRAAGRGDTFRESEGSLGQGAGQRRRKARGEQAEGERAAAGGPGRAAQDFRPAGEGLGFPRGLELRRRGGAEGRAPIRRRARTLRAARAP